MFECDIYVDSKIYVQIRDALQLHHSINFLKKRFDQLGVKAEVMKSDLLGDIATASQCVTVDPFKNQHVVFVRNLAPAVIKQDILALCPDHCHVKFGCHKKKSDHYFAQLTFFKLDTAVRTADKLNGTVLHGLPLKAEVSAMRVYDGTGVEAPSRHPINAGVPAAAAAFATAEESKASDETAVSLPKSAADIRLQDWIQYNRTVLLKNLPSLQALQEMKQVGIDFRNSRKHPDSTAGTLVCFYIV